MNHDTALVTGASSGIGLALAREFARHGHPLILVAPVASELREVAADLGRSFGVNVRTIAKDFEHPSSVDEVFAELAADRIPVEILVNHAGLSQRGKFWETPLDRDIAMLRVNVEAVVRLTKAFLPVMVKKGHGRVLNTASSGGFEPGPTMAVYHATKAFVLSFSAALAAELEDTAVTVTALCHGPVETEFRPTAGLVDAADFQRGDVAAPPSVARAAYAALKNGEPVVGPGDGGQRPALSRRVRPESAAVKGNERIVPRADAKPRRREHGDIEAKE